MRSHLRVAVVLAAALSAAGCLGPNPRQAELAQTARQECTQLLAGFQEAMRAKDPDKLPPLLDPTLPRSETVMQMMRLEAASWLRFCAGYRLFHEQAVQAASWRRWNDDQVELAVGGVNARGRELEDEFLLARGSEGWFIADFRVRQPSPGSLVIPPADVQAHIRPQVEKVMGLLKRGSIGEVYYSIPDDRYAQRPPEQSFWERITSGRAGPVNVYTDLQIVKRLNIMRWPEVGETMDLMWLGSGVLAAVYELPYAWRSSEVETLRVELVFMEEDGIWKFTTIRFYGEAIPYTDLEGRPQPPQDE